MRQGRLYISSRYSPDRTGDDKEWMLDAPCTQVDPDIFFQDLGGSNKQAKKICADCDVLEQCLAYALKTDNGKYRYGVFGGKSPKERRKIAKQMDMEETTDDNEYSYGEREGQYDWSVESLLSEEEEDDWGDL